MKCHTEKAVFQEGKPLFLDLHETSLNFHVNKKSHPGRIALRRREIMSPERPVADGESCRRRILSCALEENSVR